MDLQGGVPDQRIIDDREVGESDGWKAGTGRKPAVRRKVGEVDWPAACSMFADLQDQRENYYDVMTTTAVPAAQLNFRDVYRGPMDTVIEEAPSACLYE